MPAGAAPAIARGRDFVRGGARPSKKAHSREGIDCRVRAYNRQSGSPLGTAASMARAQEGTQDMSKSHCQPPLSQVLHDPLTHVLLLSDGVPPRPLPHLLTDPPPPTPAP